MLYTGSTRFKHYSSFQRKMSGSDKPQNFSVDKEDKERENNDKADHCKAPEVISDKEETDPKATISDRKSDKQIAEDDNGFKTPTSSDQIIPVIVQCPPAPKKPRPQLSKLKRKALPSLGACRSLQLDALTAEVESILQPIPNDLDDTQDRKNKKARTVDKDRS